MAMSFTSRWLPLKKPQPSTRYVDDYKLPVWEPPALRRRVLILTILLCWTLIVILQYYLAKTKNEGGVIFAQNVNDIPLHRSFVYLYIPTIIAVVFSILLAWIDVDAKRFEPWHQLSKRDGALAEDSLLLHYPFDFIPIVPPIALNRRHWIIFWASLAMVLTTLGIVPLQAGIFSKAKVFRTFPQNFTLSQQYMRSSEQVSALGISYARSAYGILNLNETLPPFMTRSYTLTPFVGRNLPDSSTWTVTTTLYSLDMQCEEARSGRGSKGYIEYNSSAGCSMGTWEVENRVIGDDPVWRGGENPQIRIKEFSAFYMGYYGEEFRDFDDYTRFGESLQKYCYNSGKGTFFAVLVRNKKKQSDLGNKVTAIYCKPSYFQQQVEATVDAITRSPIGIVEQGPKTPLSPELFNTSLFENTISSGKGELRSRKDSLPGATLPRYIERMNSTELTPAMIAVDNELPPMLNMAITTSKYSLQDLLDPEKLADAYRVAYRLLFVRSMADILQTDFSLATKEVPGKRRVGMEAVVLEPVFTYLVEGLLGVVSISMIALLYLTIVRKGRETKLRTDPGAFASIMSMVADSPAVLSIFDDLDCSSSGYLKDKLRNRRFKLIMKGSQCRIVEWQSPLEPEANQPNPLEFNRAETGRPMRPTEFRLFMAVPFVTLFVALFLTLGVLFFKSRPHGLPLPSKSRVVQNFVREYLPVAVATLIEPMWILINRLFCLLQPLEELQKSSKAPSSKSVGLNYSSLPPQLTIVKAIRSGHFVLMAVCGMALLANLLAIAFSGLLYQAVLPISRVTVFSPPFEPRFVRINGSSGPSVEETPTEDPIQYSGAYQGGIGEDQFLVAESNITRNTSMPSWTDDTAMYFPFFDLTSLEHKNHLKLQARTNYISAEPICKPLKFGEDYHLQLWPERICVDNGDSTCSPLPLDTFHINVQDRDGNNITCYSPTSTKSLDEQIMGYKLGRSARDGMSQACRTGKLAAELLATLQGGPNATQPQQETCASAVAIGWMRVTNTNCSSAYSDTAPDNFEEANASNTFMISCQPQITIGKASILVDSTGLLQQKAEDLSPEPDQSLESQNKYFTNGVGNFTAQSNLYIFRSIMPSYHNDSFASEYIHYFINRATGSLRFSDPNQPLPNFTDVEAPLKKAYSRLFAIWLGVNKERLLIRSTSNTQILGTTITPEERLFFNHSLLVVSEIILAIYIVVAIIIYLRRPGRYLARLPTSIAAVIALFATSSAVKDLRETSHLTAKERDYFLDGLGCRYGYGSYIGGDGCVHVGIEKVPFVRKMKQTTFEGSKVDIEMKRRVKTAYEKGHVDV